MAKKNKYCRNCGTPAMPETKFCANCGAEFEKEPQTFKPLVCEKCGAKLEDGERFCCNCGCRIEACSNSQNLNNVTSGQEVQSEAPMSDVNPDSTDAPATVTILPNKKKRISKKSKLIGITALFLVICILFTGFWQPGFFIKNEKRKAPITGVSSAMKTIARNLTAE